MMAFCHERHSCSSDQLHDQFLPTSWLLPMDLGLAWLLGLSVVYPSVLHPEELLLSLLALSQMPWFPLKGGFWRLKDEKLGTQCYQIQDAGRKLLPRELCSSFSGGRKASKSKHLKIRQEMGISDEIGFQACPSPIDTFSFLSIVKLLPPCDICWILVRHLYVTNNSILKMNKAQTTKKKHLELMLFSFSFFLCPSLFLLSV